jgi:hypothetical protein
LKKSFPKNNAEMKIIPVTEIEVIGTVKSLKTTTHLDMMEFPITP